LSKLISKFFWSSIQAFPDDSKLQSNRAAPFQCSSNGKLRFPLAGGTLLAQKGARGCGAVAVPAPPTYWRVATIQSPPQDSFSGIWYAGNGSRIGYLPTASWAYFSGLSGAGAVL
jgi:hypothetical protein